MNIWHEAFDLADEARRDIESAGGLETPDQKIALAQVFATLSVAQELSGMIEDKGLTIRVEELAKAEPKFPIFDAQQ